MQSGETPEINDYFGGLAAPNTSDLSYQLEQLVNQGVINPEQAQEYLLSASAMENVNQDPSTKAAQMAALQQLQDITSSGGLTDMDRAKLSQIRNEENTAARGSREAIIQNAQARGMGGSGIELMSQMKNQQDSATRASQRDMDVAGMAQERALQALMQQGQLAGQIGSQQFNQDASKAQSQDAISKFNAQAKSQVNQANTTAKNQAQQINLQNQQNVSNQNVALRNQQAAQQATIAQQQYENELRKRQGQAGIGSANASNQGAASQAAANAQNQTIGTGLTVAALMASDERLKDDISDFDPSDFLDKLVSKKYKYKDPSHGEGQRFGITAQDLEKSDVGASIVKDTPEGKMVDTTQATGPILASLANINKRLKDIEKDK
jgi:hypothetical protein